ncbi:MAG: hypothetical protein PHH26_00455 [Candidatus Thermoplasmatota archaeon]|nr:hypothetical protein [Candidatus Thermoplasmatota archaeon]
MALWTDTNRKVARIVTYLTSIVEEDGHDRAMAAYFSAIRDSLADANELGRKIVMNKKTRVCDTNYLISDKCPEREEGRKRINGMLKALNRGMMGLKRAIGWTKY